MDRLLHSTSHCLKFCSCFADVHNGRLWFLEGSQRYRHEKGTSVCAQVPLLSQGKRQLHSLHTAHYKRNLWRSFAGMAAKIALKGLFSPRPRKGITLPPSPRHCKIYFSCSLLGCHAANFALWERSIDHANVWSRIEAIPASPDKWIAQRQHNDPLPACWLLHPGYKAPVCGKLRDEKCKFAEASLAVTGYLDKTLQACKSMRFSGVSVPQGYEAAFQRAIWTFHHQRVYDSITKQMVHVTPLPDGGLKAVPGVSNALPEGDPDLDFLGPLMSDSVAGGIASGTKSAFSLCRLNCSWGNWIPYM